ncbi:MAG: hypothetical protein ACLSHU_01175 [Oscillospiraceae bacterium]
MALYTEASVRANLRNREGRRVFYLAPGDHLTPGARDFLRSNHIEILSPEAAKPQVYKTLQGAELREKPEHMTHLDAQVLVPRTTPDSLPGVRGSAWRRTCFWPSGRPWTRATGPSAKTWGTLWNLHGRPSAGTY